jgi:hypothetical protein
MDHKEFGKWFRKTLKKRIEKDKEILDAPSRRKLSCH